MAARQVVAQLAHFVIQRHAVLLARLLQRPQPFQFRFQPEDLLVQAFLPRQLLLQLRLPPLQLHRQFARLALHGQRTGARFLAARHRVAVIADAVRQQEIQMRIRYRQALRRLPVFGQEAQRERAAADPWRGP